MRNKDKENFMIKKEIWLDKVFGKKITLLIDLYYNILTAHFLYVLSIPSSQSCPLSGVIKLITCC